MPDKLTIGQDIDVIPEGLALDMAVQQAVMPGNLDLGPLDTGASSPGRDRIASYSTNMQAAWQVVLMVRGWNFFHRQQFLIELQLEVSKAAGGRLSNYELLANMRPEHVCRAALKAARFH